MELLNILFHNDPIFVLSFGDGGVGYADDGFLKERPGQRVLTVRRIEGRTVVSDGDDGLLFSLHILHDHVDLWLFQSGQQDLDDQFLDGGPVAPR